MKYLNLHPWQVSVKEAIEIQRKLAKRIILENSFQEIRRIAGADVSFSPKEERAYGAVVILTFPGLEVIEKIRGSTPLRFPYIPGLLTFREGPVLLSVFEKIEDEPDLIIFDGQGVAHPRRMGLATHMGILLERPTIGCAKTFLWGRFDKVGNSKSDYTLLKDKEGQTIGAVVRTRKAVKPVFVSPGHKVDYKTAVKVILTCSLKYRIPEPLRLAHTLAKEASLSPGKRIRSHEDWAKG